MADRPSIKDEDTYEALREDGASKEKAARIANAQANADQSPSRKGGKAPPYEEWTRDDLYDRARELEIEGRSGMTKAELIDALRNKQKFSRILHFFETSLHIARSFSTIAMEGTMLGWALTFLVVALIAGVLGFGGIASASAGIAQILFFVFLVLFIVAMIARAVRGRSPV